MGIDCWRQFNIAPQIFEIDEINSEVIASKFPLELGNVIQHELTDAQKVMLEKVKEKFKTFEKDGLGKTEWEMHQIELVEGTTPVKDRHYPVSPAVQELMYAEVDKMLDLGVIETSSSPWSNRCTLVRKPEKIDCV